MEKGYSNLFHLALIFVGYQSPKKVKGYPQNGWDNGLLQSSTSSVLGLAFADQSGYEAVEPSNFTDVRILDSLPPYQL